MKKLLAGLTVLLGLAVLSRNAIAKVIESYVGEGANSTTTEYTLDSNGNLTLNGALTSNGQTNTGSSAVTGNVTTTGNVTVGSYLITASSQVTIVGVGTQITPRTSYVVLAPSGLATAGGFLTGKPTISTATTLGGATPFTDGQFLIVSGTSAVTPLLLQDNGTLAGSQLSLGSATNGAAIAFTVVSSTLTRMFVYNASSTTWNLVH